MLRMDAPSKKLVAVPTTNLTQAKILERAGLQDAILRSWDAFCDELGYQELFLVGSEVKPHHSCADRIDLLALSRDGTPVVFELKRHKDKLQLLQALSYAAMVAQWDAERFLSTLGTKDDDDSVELRSLLTGDGFQLTTPEVVLLAESFDPEVILAADWLSRFGVPISAYAVSAAEHSGEVLLSIDQKFPLTGLDDIYVRRGGKSVGTAPETTWEEVIKQCEFPFVSRAVEVFRRHGTGSPHRRMFNSIYSGSPLGLLRIAFRRKYLTVYSFDQSPEAEQALRKGLGDVVPFHSWGSEATNNSGYTFTIETEAQFERFLRAVGEKA